MADEDSELFNTALTDDVPQDASPELQPEQGRPRDEAGRFVSAEQPAPQPEVQPDIAPAPQIAEQPTEQPQNSKDEIPSWRLREEAEARRAAEQRAAQYERDMATLQAQLQQLQRQNQPQPQAPDLYEDPAAFVNHGVRQQLDPIEQRIWNTQAYYSRKDAEREHGPDKVNAALQAAQQARSAGDPEAISLDNRLGSSIDPFRELMAWHQKREVFSQIGNDPEAWFTKRLQQALNDPSQAQNIVKMVTGQVQQQQRPSVTQLPPSLSRTPAAFAADDTGDDDSDSGLLKSALRR